jgi:hypothetical protein
MKANEKKFAEDMDVQCRCRLSETLLHQVEQAAKKSFRSVSAEIAYRVHKSFQREAAA